MMSNADASQEREALSEAKGFEALDENLKVEVIEPGQVPLSAIEEGEIQAAVATAKRYPRSLKRFRDELETAVTLTEDIAASCSFSLPKAGKRIIGPSVRFAEIVAASYGNLRCQSIIGEEGDRNVVAYGTAFDMEKNFAVRTSASRRITNKRGERYGDDMILTTSQAAVSIALRNAILRVVPRTFWQDIWEKTFEVASGSGSFTERRDAAFAFLKEKWGFEPATILAHLNRERIEDVTLEDVVLMRTVAREILAGDLKPSDAFPAPTKQRKPEEERQVDADAAQAALDGKPAPNDEGELHERAVDGSEDAVPDRAVTVDGAESRERAVSADEDTEPERDPETGDIIPDDVGRGESE